jgi:hypothetical protein
MTNNIKAGTPYTGPSTVYMYDPACNFQIIPADSITPGMTVSTIPSIGGGTTHVQFRLITAFETNALNERINVYRMSYDGGCTVFFDNEVYIPFAP